jgi:hypothetical protein
MKKLNPKQNRLLPGILITSVFLAFYLQVGCMTVGALKGEPGKDVSSVKIGMPKRETEQTLGSPSREWITSANLRYCVYVYDAGVPPSAENAGAYFAWTVATGGLFELFEAISGNAMSKIDKERTRVYNQILIAYDTNDIIVGILDRFSDFEKLPSNGWIIDSKP